jgi:hypothetical protein
MMGVAKRRGGRRRLGARLALQRASQEEVVEFLDVLASVINRREKGW